MDDQFDSYDSASQYGIGLDEDTVSMVSGYTARTQKTETASSQLEHDFDQLSVTDENSLESAANLLRMTEDDFDGVLEDSKDEAAADLPPHACRCVGNAVL